MNLNFHVVDIAAGFAPVQDVEGPALAALLSDAMDARSLLALAELVDWELATRGVLSGRGKRCDRALRQRVLRCAFPVLVDLAGRSGVVNEMYRQLSREGEALAPLHVLPCCA